MLIHFGVIPYIVFDGDYLPSKAATEVERAKKREESKRKGLELYQLNKPSQAHLELQKAVDVTPEMARQFIDELKKIGVQYVVAPYEADAQLAYLERKGIIQGIVSEDSDLLVFGSKCLLTKLDQYGDCVEINRADFTACREVSLVGWSDAEFRRMAILSGCDYLASINRMGLKSAYRMVRKYKTIDKILRMLQFDGQFHVPTGYLEAFYKAELTFLHQRVFCPLKNDVVMMTDIGNEAQPEDLSFIGSKVEQDIAIGVAKGDLDPMTKAPIYVRSSVKTTPKTPWGNPRRNAADTFSNPKSKKSIDSFFKAKRTPLAELDPNSFTPSPTQQRLLEQANEAIWSPSPAPEGPPSVRPSVSMPSSASRPALSSRVSNTITRVDAPLAGASPPKRRRLCLEPLSSQDVEGTGKAAVRSRFFTSNIPDPSPSIRNKRKGGKGKETDITIWSDDSIEDVMAELPDGSEGVAPSKRGKFEIFKDDDQEKLRNPAFSEMQSEDLTGEDSQSSTASRGTVTSETSTDSQATSITSSQSSVAKILDKHVTAELAVIAQKYTYQPETERMASQRSDIENSKEPPALETPTQPTPKPPLLRQQSMTPLQRLGVGALNRSKSCSGFFSSAGPSKDPQPARDNALKHRIPNLPFVHSIGPDASMAKGSEDAMIPDSEESADDVSEADEQAKPRIDLGRFAFAG